MKLISTLARLAANSPLLISLALAPAAIACGDDNDSSSDDDMADDDMADDADDDMADDDADDDIADDDVVDDDADDDMPASNTIVDVAMADENFSTLVDALVATGLDETLSGEGPFTVFAPTNAAFELLPEGLVDGLDSDTLAAVLTYHVVAGEVPAADVVTLSDAETVQGSSVNINVMGENVYLNGLTQVVTTDIETDNGIIHVIDSVLIPGAFPGSIVDVVTSYPRLSTLAGAVTEDVATTLSGDGLTLLAPVNSAFDGLELPEDEATLESILLYHGIALNAPAATVVELASVQSAGGPFMGIDASDGVRLNDGSKMVDVIYTDIAVGSGDSGSTIHLIDQVLIPPPDIATVATNAGLTELVAALGAANVPGTSDTFAAALQGDGPFTVFAPSNAAFEAIPAPGFGSDLADVLGAHAIAGVVDSKAVVAAIGDTGLSPATLTSASDNQLGLAIVGEAVAINSMVQVTQTDIPASNGIIHLVDSVIIPADIEFPGNIVEAVSAYPLFSSLVTAVGNADAGVATALTGVGPLTLFAPVNPAFDGVDVSQDLTNVLLYHATSGAVDSTFVVNNFQTPADVTMANGADTTVDGAELMVNDANLIGTDLRTDNGIIHILDGVLMPPAQ